MKITKENLERLESTYKGYLEGGFNQEGGYRCMQKFLKMEQRPTAIFAANDVIALGAILAIYEEGTNKKLIGSF